LGEFRKNCAGKDNLELARYYGVSDRTIVRWKRRAGVPNGRGIQLTPEVRARMEELLDQGCSYREVGKKLCCSPDTVRVNFPGRGWTKEQCAAIARAERWAARV
jgi:uncharacterized protein YjcR